jgi:hypothetical protein
LAQLEEALVPLYMHHRFQVDAALNSVGGMDYIYALRGDGRAPMRMASGSEQRAALSALLRVLQPSELALPQALLSKIPPRPSGYGRSRELFPRYTGLMFDAITPAGVAADQVVSGILAFDRTARLVEQSALDPSLPGLGEVIDSLLSASFGSASRSAYETEVQRTVQRTVIDELIDLAGNATMPQVRAMATFKLRQQLADIGSPQLARGVPAAVEQSVAHSVSLADDIRRFLERPVVSVAPRTAAPVAPPGAPIGDAAPDWLMLLDPPCNYLNHR